MALYRSPLTVTLWPSSFLKKYGPMIPPAHKAHQTKCASSLNKILAYENREQRQSRFGPIRRIYALLDDRLASILARVGFCKHANQDPSSKSSIKWMDTYPIPVLDGGWTHSALPSIATLYSSNSFFCTHRTASLGMRSYQLEVTWCEKRSMVNRINCFDGRFCRR
ncbi:hypothetical protein TNCV_2123571 [Trichonephila clavipes]|nr:hypothetical protein TNCV_2123571 [Trichonephila clavipes]